MRYVSSSWTLSVFSVVSPGKSTRQTSKKCYPFPSGSALLFARKSKIPSVAWRPERLLVVLVFFGLGVTGHELIHSPGCIHEALLTRKEGMRPAGDFQLDKRILFAVLPDNSFFTFRAGTGQKCKIRRHILENDKPILWVDALLHGAKVQSFTSREPGPPEAQYKAES